MSQYLVFEGAPGAALGDGCIDELRTVGFSVWEGVRSTDLPGPTGQPETPQTITVVAGNTAHAQALIDNHDPLQWEKTKADAELIANARKIDTAALLDDLTLVLATETGPAAADAQRRIDERAAQLEALAADLADVETAGDVVAVRAVLERFSGRLSVGGDGR